LFHLDALMSAKVLSMLCCSLGIVFLYLLAVELTGDRLPALFAALLAALQPWVLQTGPSGSALSAGFALSLGVFFLLRRGQHALAAFAAGACTLIFWQAVGLLAVVLTDPLMVSPRVPLSWQRALVPTLTFGAGVLPWIAYAGLNHVPVLPLLLPLGEFPGPSLFGAIIIVLLVALAAGAIALAATHVFSERALLHDAVTIWLWILWLTAAAFMTSRELMLLTVPFLMIYALIGARALLKALGHGRSYYTALVGISALVLLQQQLELGSRTRPVMHETRSVTEQVRVASGWLREHAANGAIVAAERFGTVRYFTGMYVRPFNPGSRAEARFVVTSVPSVEGYARVFELLPEQRWLPGESMSNVAVWEKQ